MLATVWIVQQTKPFGSSGGRCSADHHRHTEDCQGETSILRYQANIALCVIERLSCLEKARREEQCTKKPSCLLQAAITAANPSKPQEDTYIADRYLACRNRCIRIVCLAQSMSSEHCNGLSDDREGSFSCHVCLGGQPSATFLI
jgi:hypothetical protein